MKFVAFFLVMVLVSGCGYKPSAKFSRAVVGEKISTSVAISLIDPENTVIIKDAVDAAIIKVFHASLVPKNISQTHLTLGLSNPSYSPIQYDSDGFIVAYRATVNLNILRKTAEVSKNYVVKGTYDFSVTPNAIITDKERFDAIKFSSEKAIRSFVAQVSAEGARKESNEKSTISEMEEQEVLVKPDLKEKQVLKEEITPVDLKPEVKEKEAVNPVRPVTLKLDAIEKAYQMERDGLISEEEFKTMKNNILTE